jgi:6,7-dimethyl-8-ribityllumazine synthase
MPSQKIEGKLSAKGYRFAIVVGRFNELINRKLVEGAQDCLVRHFAVEEDITIVWVPGSFEIPLTAKKLAKTKKYDALICTSAIIRGGTPHFDYLAAEVTKGIAAVSLETGVPITYGIITADTIEQAIERAGTKAGNKGWEAAMAAIEMVDVIQQLQK